MTLQQAREARCAVADCRSRMGGILAVQAPRAAPVELGVCREHGDAIEQGAPFGVHGVMIVMDDASPASVTGRPEAVWERAEP